MIEYKGDFDFKNSEVAKNFTAHIKEQLPWVDLARRYCRFLVQSVAPKNALIYDIGSANGENYRAFEDIIKQRKIHIYGCANTCNCHFVRKLPNMICS